MLSIQIKSFGEWRELDYEETTFPLNYECTTLTNPTKYATEFTKSINLPLTKNNMYAFGVMNQLNSVMTTELSLARKIPCRIFEGSDLMLEGSFHVTSVDLFSRTITGNVYSKMNEWMNTLLKADFGNGLPKFIGEVYMNKNMVKYSFERDPATRSTGLVLPGEEGYSIHDFIGMAPTVNGDHNGFDSSNIVYNKSEGSVSDVVTGNVWECLGLSDKKRDEAADVLDKPLERMMLQYRSYNQKPYIYIDALTKLIQRACLENPEIPDMELDPEWFNENNSDWRNVVYLLPNLVYEKEDGKKKIETTLANGDFVVSRMMPNNDVNLEIMRTGNLSSAQEGSFENMFDSGWFVSPVEGLLSVAMNAKTRAMNFTGVLNWGEHYPNAYRWFDAKVQVLGNIYARAEIIDENENILAYKQEILFGPTSPAVHVYRRTEGDAENTRSIYNWTLPSKIFNLEIDDVTVTNGTRYKIRAGLVFDPNFTTYGTRAYGMFTANTPFMDQSLGWSRWIFTSRTAVTGQEIAFTPSETTLTLKTNTKTSTNLDEKTFWPYKEDNSPFTVFLKYCKMMNLYFWYNSFRDKIVVLPRETFFHKALYENDLGEIEDWTNKLDLSRECVFRPIQWDKKYLELNYESTGANKISDFEQEYGITYGTKKIETMYEYNTDTEKLLDGKYKINASAEQSIYMRTLNDFKRVFAENIDIEGRLVKEAYIINRNDENSSNVYNCFFYRLNSKPWDTEMTIGPSGEVSGVYITDDSEQEIIENSFCYQNPWRNNGNPRCLNAVVVNKYPVLSHYDPNGTGKCLLFSQPAQDYFDPQTIERNSNDLYARRWARTIDEIRNEQNKVVECYLWLKPKDWREIIRGKFILINECVYMVNKVTDYQLRTDLPTKVELVQINDIVNWTTPYTNQ